MKILILLALLVVLLNAVVVKLPLERRSLSYIELTKRAEFRKNLLTKQRGDPTSRFLFSRYPCDFFTTNITLGTPPQQFLVSVDTWALETWVLYNECDFEACRERDNRYYPRKSNTSRKDGGDFGSEYGSGIAYGFRFTDDFKWNEFTVENLVFGAVDYVDDFFDELLVDGNLGLGVAGPQSSKDAARVLQRIGGELDLPVYTLWVGSHTLPSQGTIQAALTLGGTDDKNCESTILTTVEQYEYYNGWDYAFNVTKIKMGDRETPESIPAYLAVGAPFVEVDDDETLAYIHNLLNANFDFSNQFYTVDCSLANTAPDLVFEINGVEFNIPAQDYILDLELESGDCVLAIEGSWDIDIKLGIPFITNFCYTLNFFGNTIDFSKAIH